MRAGGAAPRQQIPHRAVVPFATLGGSDAAQVQRVGTCPDRHHASGLQTTHHGQHVGGEGIGTGTASGCPQGLRLGEVGRVPRSSRDAYWSAKNS